MRAAGGDARFPALDVAEEAGRVDALRRVEAERSRLDVLVNNAGINVRAPLEDYPVEAFDRMMATREAAFITGVALPVDGGLTAS